MKLDLSLIKFEDMIIDDGDDSGINVPDKMTLTFGDRILIFKCIYDGPLKDSGEKQ